MSKIPFHDLHHEEGCDIKHIRLISEGGNSLAKSPEPFCIDSLQVTQTCTTESQHAIYPASGTGRFSPGKALFSISLEHVPELERGSIPPVLRDRFAQQGTPLSECARLTVKRGGEAWSLSDQQRDYLIRKLTRQLTVYRR